MSDYLRTRQGHYYLRLRVPKDLLGIIPQPEILKSLRTRDRKSAHQSVTCFLPRFLEVFTLTRTGFISQEQATERLNTLLGRKPLTMATETSPQKEEAREEATRSQKANSPSLSRVIQEYLNDKQHGWTEKTLLEYRGYMKLIQEILDVETVADIDRNEVRRLRDTLCRLPSNLYKRHPDKTIKQVLEMDNITPMSTTTVNKLLTLFGSIMRHCVKEGYRKDNPVEGLKVKQSRRADEERKAYSMDDLKKIVSALPSPSDKPERHWIPLIGMLSGMRLGEICGMHLEDIREVDGVWCFDVNDEGDKRLKNLSSKRIVPIHPHLIEHGFLDFVDNLRKEGSTRLWPNLVRREIDGYCHALGNWFGRFNRQHVTTDPLKTFHSFRHTFADTLKQRGVQEPLISELMGHANGNITTGRYGKRYQPKVLLEAVCRLDYAKAFPQT